ncbi:MAG: hypothetical protein H6Q65_648 [Firmicutes bacterium]|nr:hypothetical protein [Bacillota bacterium]
MQKMKWFALVICFTMIAVFPLSTFASEQKTGGELTAKIEGANFWTSYYSTSYGGEETVTVYALKSVVVDIKTGNQTLDSFTFTAMGEQSHQFSFPMTNEQNITVQYRAITYSGREFAYAFSYRPGAVLTIANNTSPITVKTPFLNYR